MPSSLFVAATPLHTFLSLGLMNGPMRDGKRVLALVDRKTGSSDHIGDALEAAPPPGVEIWRFRALGDMSSARAELQRMTQLTRKLNPEVIVTGNDRRLEFHAAIRGAPESRRAYVDDGLYSYVPRETVLPAWIEWLSNLRRGLKYGLRLERPSMVGGSRAVQEAYVLLPEQVHTGLRRKTLHLLEPRWFAMNEVRRVCSDAARLAGVDPAGAGDVRLLVLLPHHRFLSSDSGLETLLRKLIERHGGAGPHIAIKRHPASHRDAATQALLSRLGPVIEWPARLPVETLAPLLHDALVVGAQTTGLLSLKLLSHNVEVKSMSFENMRAKDRFAAQSLRVYESAGIHPLDAGPS